MSTHTTPPDTKPPRAALAHVMRPLTYWRPCAQISSVSGLSELEDRSSSTETPEPDSQVAALPLTTTPPIHHPFLRTPPAPPPPRALPPTCSSPAHALLCPQCLPFAVLFPRSCLSFWFSPRSLTRACADLHPAAHFLFTLFRRLTRFRYCSFYHAFQASGDEFGRGLNIHMPESCLWWKGASCLRFFASFPSSLAHPHARMRALSLSRSVPFCLLLLLSACHPHSLYTCHPTP